MYFVLHQNMSLEQATGQAYIRPSQENEECLAQIQTVHEIIERGFLFRIEIDKAHFP